MKTTKLFRNYLNGKINSKDSTITFNIDVLEEMVTLPEGDYIIQITDKLYMNQLDMKGLYKELLELPNFVIPFANKKSGWNFCLNEVEEHELDKLLNFPKVWEGGEDIDTDDESLINEECLIDEDVVEAMRCYSISFDALVYLSKEYTPEGGERINNWMKRVWEDYESARLYLNDTNNNGLAEHKRKLWHLDTTITDELSWHYKDDLFPVYLKDVIVYNKDTLKTLIEQGSGSPDTPLDMINLSELFDECLRGVPLYHVEDKISNKWKEVGKPMVYKTISKKKFDTIIPKYIKKNKSSKKNIAELFNKFNKTLNNVILMNEYVKAVGQTFVCSFKDDEGDEGLNYDLEINDIAKGKLDVSIGDRNYVMGYVLEDNAEEAYINIRGRDVASTCRDIYFTGLINIINKLVNRDNRLLGVAIVFIVDGKMLDFIDAKECVDCRIDL